MALFHTPTLLSALVMSNGIMAGAWWFASAKTPRAGLHAWAGGLVAQALAAAVLLSAPQGDIGKASLIAAGVLMACGYSLQARAILAFLDRAMPIWTSYAAPVIAFLMLVGLPVDAKASIALDTVFGPWLLALHGFTITLSFAFLLIHNTRSHDLATRDPLTGLYNRRMFNELANAALSRARRTQASVSLLALDLDRFKRVNDAYGHLTGDQVLTTFAKVLGNTLRKEDLVARYGGEEFVALLPDTTQSAAVRLAERVRTSLAKMTIRSAGHHVHITVSIGLVSERGSQLPSLKALLSSADEALYAAKELGRNRVVVHDDAAALRLSLATSRSSGNRRSPCARRLRRPCAGSASALPELRRS
jgi:diguanylate cyclase (GGDEF)-like protein